MPSTRMSFFALIGYTITMIHLLDKCDIYIYYCIICIRAQPELKALC